jgi:hypothetical protein
MLYQEPDYSILGDRDIVRELNKKLLNNPSLELPEGYKKVQEKDLVLHYKLPDYFDIPESHRVSTEILDSIFFDELK